MTLMELKCLRGNDTLEVHITDENLRFRMRNNTLKYKLDVEISPDKLEELINILNQHKPERPLRIGKIGGVKKLQKHARKLRDRKPSKKLMDILCQKTKPSK